MRATDPHYLLFSTAVSPSAGAAHWRFVLQPVGSDASLAVADAEVDAPCSRLELLAVVRGLEALAQPSRVTLLTGSRYVIRGIRRGISQWRERSWRWERFGQLVPIRDCDLWQRVDRALQFHHVECCEWHDDELPGATFAIQDAIDRPATEAVSSEVDVAKEAALVIVRREGGRRVIPRQVTNWPLAAALERVCRGVWTQIAAFGRPAFTRAA
jgi:ribonuclease HI